MAHSDEAQTVAQLDHLIQGVAKHLAEKLYGPDGPADGTPFDTIEQIACQLGQAISAELIQQALSRGANRPEEVDCPDCGHALRPADPESRLIHTPVGPVHWDEPKFHCPSCRKAFFPSVDEPRP